MPSNFKLAMMFIKLAKQHGPKILHGADIDLLTRDLGDALRRQKKVIQDQDMGTLETAYEALPIIAEVKLLTFAVSKKLQLDTKGKSAADVLQEIVQNAEARSSTAAQEIKDTLDWTRAFFAQPEIQEILKADMIEIEKPERWNDFGGIGKAFKQSATRVSQELNRLQEFLKKAKQMPEKIPEPKAKPPKKSGPKK